MVKWIVCHIVIPGLLTLLFVLAITQTRAEARPHKYEKRTGSQFSWALPHSREAGYRKSHHKKRYAKRRRHDANGNIVLATITTANGVTAKVAAAWAEKFQNFINEIERDFIYPEKPDIIIKGNRIRDLGCYTRGGHMPGSKHYLGLACDFDQTARNRTAPFMYRATAIARAFGLTDGATWPVVRGERYTGPDAGHIEAPTRFAERIRTTRTASSKRHKRYARMNQ